MIPTDNFTGWHKATTSTDKNGGCVEVGYTPEHVAVRDTKNRTIPPHVFTHHEWTTFLTGAKSGKFDL